VLWIALGLAALACGTAWAEAYRPSDDAEVLERLPTPGAEHRELRALRDEVKAHPDRPALALSLARRYIELGRTDSDPRYYGYAEAVLARWLRPPHPHPDALVLRATVLQNRHDFQAARADLEAALRVNPRLPQAWLTRAAIHEVQGDYAAALGSCLALARLAASLTAAVCLESALSLSGQLQSAYERLRRVVAASAGKGDELPWARVTLAEMAERLDRPEEAESWYRAALAAGRRSPYLLTTYADFLLDRKRPVDVIALLEGETRADPLLLRMTLAEQQLNHPRCADHTAMLKARFEASRARGDLSHQGDESRYTLYILHDPTTALKLALANWSAQKEPRDARLVLEAAHAAGQPEAARPVREFVERSGLEDARLERLLADGGASGT
jgi:tetratricopeptide (TPR) repeat protein